MIATTSSEGFEALSALQAAGYEFVVGSEPTEPEKHPRTVIKIDGPEKPAPELLGLIDKHRDALKAAALLSDPPEWLQELIAFWFAGHITYVQRTNPATGKVQEYPVRVSVQTICALVAASVGMDRLEWEKIREEVEDALGHWEGA